ncbi:MAG: hypothetical protein IJU26_01635 [Synergistaceae bacterium]|nr:hypothetical protein [Synergistaceae bacterium]
MDCSNNKLTGTLDCSNNPDIHVTLPTIATDRLGVSSLKCNNAAGVVPMDSNALGAYLTTMECRNANITSLDMSSALPTEIDVSENPNFTSIIWNSSTQGYSINSINISGTQMRVQGTINAISGGLCNPYYFYANSMDIGTLDVSSFTNLKGLHLENNHLTP